MMNIKKCRAWIRIFFRLGPTDLAFQGLTIWQHPDHFAGYGLWYISDPDQNSLWDLCAPALKKSRNTWYRPVQDPGKEYRVRIRIISVWHSGPLSYTASSDMYSSNSGAGATKYWIQAVLRIQLVWWRSGFISWAWEWSTAPDTSFDLEERPSPQRQAVRMSKVNDKKENVRQKPGK